MEAWKVHTTSILWLRSAAVSCWERKNMKWNRKKNKFKETIDSKPTIEYEVKCSDFALKIKKYKEPLKILRAREFANFSSHRALNTPKDPSLNDKLAGVYVDLKSLIKTFFDCFLIMFFFLVPLFLTRDRAAKVSDGGVASRRRRWMNHERKTLIFFCIHTQLLSCRERQRQQQWGRIETRPRLLLALWRRETKKKAHGQIEIKSEHDSCKRQLVSYWDHVESIWDMS